jgi:hypothetical protein
MTRVLVKLTLDQNGVLAAAQADSQVSILPSGRIAMAFNE